VNATASRLHRHRMPEMQHLVIDQILHRTARSRLAIEDAADDDGVVRGVVVPETAPRHVVAPGEQRPAHEPEEETVVQALEYLFQVVDFALGPQHPFASAGLTDALGLAKDSLTRGEVSVPLHMSGVERPAVELG